MEKKEITNRQDIILLVDTFYDKVKADDRIGYIFNDIAKVDWGKHLPTMYDFWESLLLDGNNYRGHTMAPHFRINKLIPLESAHFDRWVALFEATVNELFKGEKAGLAITRARSIKDIMAYKMKQINHPDDNKKIPLINPGS
ncbi:MAG: group III truncated hemoglobin [Chitinophaga sp.]|uniref:group III truncated hemoglobin n=1 Tax=Chitinophaga sp. TaxID=1869181 RepID=UPI001B200BD1|nr:group III truncated hemoglobin [Chitinophaga sp.]MBO9729318.1 group III truncated hemoglobin [Chitinophaga sp.]